MKTINIRRGLDIPLAGVPEQVITKSASIKEVALIGDDYPGLKPTMLVETGDRIQLGQPLFTDKKNEGFFFTSPGSGMVVAINRGEKRRFESLVIRLEGDGEVSFPEAMEPLQVQSAETIRSLLHQSGLWSGFRTRPFGLIPRAKDTPESLFITALDSQPLAADPEVLIQRRPKHFLAGLRVLRRLLKVPLHLCARSGADLPGMDEDGIESWGFAGPHPAGLPSTHIHHIDPVHAGKQVWHIEARDVLAIGHLFTTGRLSTEKIIALAGPGVQYPRLINTRAGASLQDLCRDELVADGPRRIISGSVLDGRIHTTSTGFLGRYHRQVTVISEGDGRSLFAWLAPGSDRFSRTGLFASRLFRSKRFSMTTAAWGGRRAIYPLPVYDSVMPLDIMAIPLLKSLAVGDTEKAAALGCLELIEEDLALCSFVCPGKNEYGPMLRAVLNAIQEGE
ncbi:Na(+)-translocating NADH-quinone reductase subunit A [Desulfobulbus alkaliphilus]|uniref:Na(+)-translocating NADH-quinone reductase subunit A n=1 Tax=Desulfobulbus alkaliphilus TaxID=869814 RepID=UPI001962FFF0|nr:Na(+)-translocating NADH-quinone reductase subunit A [Desulfobulbus alkaliphilus]MBM9537506.1 Na(+)-translocating NADH-quinone reductase subunit A [Desulfobulbus alkaliphilus]